MNQEASTPLGGPYNVSAFGRDVSAGIVVFLVALPLCLGIALASGAPLFSGLVAGIVGGIVVGSISGSHTSVSGPAAGLAAIVAAQITNLGSFESFLLAVLLAGAIQVGLGVARAGALSAFFPSSVIKGLLAAIGVLLILKQIPHVLGHDSDPEGDLAFSQPDQENTFSELITVFLGDIHIGAAVVGAISLAILIFWGRCPPLKKSIVPAPLIVVLIGVGLYKWFLTLGDTWAIGPDHLVQIPVGESATDFLSFLTFPDFSQWTNPAIYVAAITIAIVASLETLLNLEAVDKLDPLKRVSPPSRELVAQGVGNMVSGCIGGLPVTSVIIRSSVNVTVGARTKLSAILHGFLLLICVGLFPVYLNMIPLASLAAILLVTGFKLASPQLFRQMWSEGRYQFLPFIITLTSIVLTDLLIGILIGLGVSVLFILNSNLRRPIRRIVETHLGGDVLHIELANQVSFLNRAALVRVFDEAKPGSRILIDARETDYIDPDVLSLIRDFRDNVAPARGISVSLRGFRDKYNLQDDIQFADYSTRELRDRVTPEQVLDILREGNRRFRTGNRLSRDFERQVVATATQEHPLAVIVGCIDSRVPAELVFDLGIGDIYSVRVAGNVIGSMALGSVEYAVLDAGVKLVVVLGHTHCGALTAAITVMGEKSQSRSHSQDDHSHLKWIIDAVEPVIAPDELARIAQMDDAERRAFVDEVAERIVQRSVDDIIERSEAIRQRVENGQVMVVGAIYDVGSGRIDFLTDDAVVAAQDQAN